jgi:hypothetical protein
MTLWFDLVRAVTVLNFLLLVGLGTVWVRNHVEFRSKHTLGLSAFAGFLLVENTIALYVYYLDPDLVRWFETAVPPLAGRAMFGIRACETVALAFLAWVTID